MCLYLKRCIHIHIYIYIDIEIRSYMHICAMFMCLIYVEFVYNEGCNIEYATKKHNGIPIQSMLWQNFISATQEHICAHAYWLHKKHVFTAALFFFFNLQHPRMNHPCSKFQSQTSPCFVCASPRHKNCFKRVSFMFLFLDRLKGVRVSKTTISILEGLDMARWVYTYGHMEVS